MGSSGTSDLTGSVSLINTVLQPMNNISGRFAHYLLRSASFQQEFYRWGKGIVADLWSTGWSEMRNILLAVPPLLEQESIVGFLDAEVKRIDDLIVNQEHLQKLIAEKRKAVVAQAITKGLNPGAAMKPSGVEFLGEVPAHWQIVPLMRLVPEDRGIMYGIILPGPSVDDGVPIVKGGDVAPGRLTLKSLKRTTAKIEAAYARSRLRTGDIVYAIRGSIGAAEIVPREIEGANLTQDAARVSPKPDINGDWLLWALRAQPIFAQLDRKATGATIRGINIFDLKRVRIPVPPADEQNTLAEYIASTVHVFEALERDASAIVDLLQERRTALIDAAVGGNIDVRRSGASGHHKGSDNA